MTFDVILKGVGYLPTLEERWFGLLLELQIYLNFGTPQFFLENVIPLYSDAAYRQHNLYSVYT